MQPNLLLSPGRIDTDSQDCLHLLHTQEQYVSRNIPPDALRARRRCQATLVRPKLMEPIDLIQCQSRIERRIDPSLHISEAHQSRQLAEESARCVAGIDTEGEDGANGSFGVDVDKMQLGFASVALHAVICGRVNVPAGEVDGFVVVAFLEREGGERCVVAFGVGDAHCGPVAPVVETASDVLHGVVEMGNVVEREALG